MKKYTAGALKVLGDYFIMFMLFIVFLLIGVNHLTVYTSIILILGLLILYADFNTIGLKERKPANQIVNYPLKGFVYGFMGFSPVILIAVLLNFLDFGSKFNNTIKLAILKVFTGPVYGFLSSNLLFLLIIPVAAGISYMTGYYGIGKPKFMIAKPKKKVVKR